MNEKEKLDFYLQKLETLAQEHIESQGISALEALRLALNFVESEMTGY